MDVGRGIWYSNFSACKEIYCIEEQTDHRTTFPLDKPGSWEAKTFGKLVGKPGEMKHLGKSCKCEYRQKQTHLQLAKCFAKIFVDVSKVVLRWSLARVDRRVASHEVLSQSLLLPLPLPLPCHCHCPCVTWGLLVSEWPTSNFPNTTTVPSWDSQNQWYQL